MARKSDRQKRILRALQRADAPGIPGIEPAKLRSILEQEASKLLRGGDEELPDNSLFGDGRQQRELF
jgi:hypothetical protein